MVAEAPVVGERFVPPRREGPPESVAGFFTRRFGAAVARTLVDAFVSGIYAGDVDRAGIDSTFPELSRMEREHGGVMKGMGARARARRASGAPKPPPMTLRGFPDGMEEIVRALAGSLGPRIVQGSAVESIAARPEGGFVVIARDRDGAARAFETESLVLAVPAPEAARLLGSVLPDASARIAGIRYAGIAVVHAVIPAAALAGMPRGFGFLVPRREGMRSLGWLFSSTIFEGRAARDEVALTGFIGGATDPEAVSLPEDRLRAIALGDLARAFGLVGPPEPRHFAIVRQEPGLPQMDLEQVERIRAVRAALAGRPDLALAGNWIGGVSLNDCVKTARAAAAALAARVPSGRPGAIA